MYGETFEEICELLTPKFDDKKREVSVGDEKKPAKAKQGMTFLIGAWIPK